MSTRKRKERERKQLVAEMKADDRRIKMRRAFGQNYVEQYDPNDPKQVLRLKKLGLIPQKDGSVKYPARPARSVVDKQHQIS